MVTMTLPAWMTLVLRFAGGFNLLVGAAMVTLYHEGYKLLDASKPELVLPVQVMGILVALFGAGYLLTAADPWRNRNILLLGMLSKAVAGLLALTYVVTGDVPWWFAIVVFFADLIYVPAFWMILRRIDRLGLHLPSGGEST